MLKNFLPKINSAFLAKKQIILVIPLTIIFLSLLLITFKLQNNFSQVSKNKIDLEQQLNTIKNELETLKNQDQIKRNNELEQEIKNINQTYQKAVSSYEEILKLEDEKIRTEDLRKDLAQILRLLADRNYASASAVLSSLNQKISSEQQKLATPPPPVENIATNNQAPASGYQRQNVKTDKGTFLVDLVAADLNTAKVLVDTASESDCANDCPVLSLTDYVARNNAFAGVNGSYFCPATYPSCADKKNSFDTLLMNKNKKYFNSDNNVYSTVPAAIFSGNSARFVGQSLEWGRDTGVDAVIANRPLLLLGGEIKFNGEGEPKEGNRGGRSFIGNKGSTVYIGVVHSATVAEAAVVLQTLGLENAINLDDGGSTALWFGGYKVGPGRNLPNAVILVRK